MDLVADFNDIEMQNRLLLLGLEDMPGYAFLMLDAKGLVQTWNKGAERLYGYDDAEILGKYFSVFYPREITQTDYPAQGLERTREQGRFEEEGWRARKDGSLFWARMVLTATYDKNGDFVGFCQLIQSLPQQSEARVLLKQSESRFRLLVQGVKDYALFMLDPSGIIQTWNEGAQRLKGYTADEIIGRHFSIFYSEEAKQNGYPQYELKIARETGRYEEDGWRFRKDGTPFWANVIITAIYSEDGTLVGFSKVTRDLSDRKQIEDELRKTRDEAELAKENYRLLIEGVRDYAIIMLDPQGIIKSWNTGAERINGYTADEIIGRHFSQFYLPVEVEAGKCEFELKYAEKEGVFEDEGWRIRKDGTKFWANVIVTCLRGAQGQLVGFSKITRDITQKKEIELSLQESEKRYRMMADKVLERANQYEALSHQFETANKELESFSYSVSHDLRAPLRGIQGYSEILQETDAFHLTGEGKHALERIIANTQRMEQLIDGLLNLSRLNRFVLKKETLNLSLMAQSILADLQVQDPSRNIDIRVREDVLAQGDPVLLKSVLTNLLENAWKFTSEVNPAMIEVGTKEQDGKVIYYVKDNGVGFDMLYRDKLFGVFQRLHTEQEFPGTGIGLATVQRIIHRHGGDVWAEGQVAQGATFYFSLE